MEFLTISTMTPVEPPISTFSPSAHFGKSGWVMRSEMGLIGAWKLGSVMMTLGGGASAGAGGGILPSLTSAGGATGSWASWVTDSVWDSGFDRGSESWAGPY